jgi:hypothetical protein
MLAFRFHVLPRLDFVEVLKDTGNCIYLQVHNTQFRVRGTKRLRIDIPTEDGYKKVYQLSRFKVESLVHMGFHDYFVNLFVYLYIKHGSTFTFKELDDSSSMNIEFSYKKFRDNMYKDYGLVLYTVVATTGLRILDKESGISFTLSLDNGVLNYQHITLPSVVDVYKAKGLITKVLEQLFALPDIVLKDFKRKLA